jgi:hypothetical protein
VLHASAVQEHDGASARDYIGTVRWQYAKTMPDGPHEYTVKAWRPELAPAFERFCRLVLAKGMPEAWPPAPAETIYRNHYLVIGQYKYWAMGLRDDADLAQEKTVINRAAV